MLRRSNWITKEECMEMLSVNINVIKRPLDYLENFDIFDKNKHL